MKDPELNQEDYYQRLRGKMVEGQLRKRGIKNPYLLEVMGRIPRHLFVPDNLAERAYDDCPLPIGENQTISQPYIVALMTEHLELEGSEKVLELGTGSGYQAAIICELARELVTIERREILVKRAGDLLEKLGFENFRVILGDGTEGFPEDAPYDRVIITAATPSIPQPVVDQLEEGGIVIAPVGRFFDQDLVKGIKRGRKLKKTYLGGCRFVKLVGKYGFPQ
jgi:protein-L-isoaspartate(D-aspartate) O-methyltransferase